MCSNIGIFQIYKLHPIWPKETVSPELCLCFDEKDHLRGCSRQGSVWFSGSSASISFLNFSHLVSLPYNIAKYLKTRRFRVSHGQILHNCRSARQKGIAFNKAARAVSLSQG